MGRGPRAALPPVRLTYRIVFRPQAEAEITEAADWYEAQRQGLGQDFLRKVDQTISTVADNPLRFRTILRETRRAPLQRFPYGILYRIRNEKILIVAYMHVRRDPRRWQTRN